VTVSPIRRPDQAPGDSGTPILELADIHAGYERVEVIHGIDLAVRTGQIVALLGPNGAGKTTLLRTASGLLSPTRGRVLIDGKDVTRLPPNRRARDGLCLIPEGRGIFRSLTVKDNLRMQLPPWAEQSSFEVALETFPILRQRLGQTAGTLSGGQQQMLALSRAYIAQPRVVLLDEVSMGLAPGIVEEIFSALNRLAATGAALLLVEQYVNRALELADSVVLLDRGRVRFAGPANTVDYETLLAGYLGDASGRPGRTGEGAGR